MLTDFELDELMVDADPTPGLPATNLTSETARWVYEEATREPQSMRRLRLRPRVALTITTAVLAITALLIWSLAMRTTSPVNTRLAAVLHQAALAAARSQPAKPAQGQYLYTETNSLYQASIFERQTRSTPIRLLATAQYNETEQSWLGTNGQGSGMLSRSALTYPSASDERSWNTSIAGQAFSSHFTLIVNEPSLAQRLPNVSKLPVAPKALETILAAGLDGTNPDLIPNSESAVFERAARLLVGPDLGLNPRLASALYMVLEQQPKTTLLGTSTDHLGRRGIGVASKSSFGTSEIIFNPTSGKALEAAFAPPSVSSARGFLASTPPCALQGCRASQSETTVISPLWVDLNTSEIINSSQVPTA